MTPEQTFMTELVSGRLPALTLLLGLFALLLWKGGARLDRLTAAVEALPLALADTKTETKEKIEGLRDHVTSEADRVIAVIEDRRLSEMGDAIVEVKRAVSEPDLRGGRGRAQSGDRSSTR